MSIGIKTLGGLLLPRQLECPELDQSLSRAQTLKTTLAGNPVIYARQLAYRPLTLIAESDLNDPATVEPTTDGGLGMHAHCFTGRWLISRREGSQCAM